VRKVVIHKAGGFDRLEVEEHPSPTVGPGEVRIDVAAIGVNFADCIVRMGLYSSAREYVGWPITPGFEVAGTIAALGEGVDGMKVGDEVMAVTRFGGYATELVVPAFQVLPRPASLSMEETAAFPTVHLTAWYALRELANTRSGTTILVHSAAGGVGGALVQIGKIIGCKVAGVVGRSHKKDLVRELGADWVIDKSAQDLWQQAERIAPNGYDVVLDANGVDTLRQSYKHMAPGGRLVVYGFHTMFAPGKGKPPWVKMAAGLVRTPLFSPLTMTNDNKSVLAFNLSYLFDKMDLFQEAMGELISWIEAGKLRSPPVTAFAFDDVASAHRAIESGQTVGKLVLVP